MADKIGDNVEMDPELRKKRLAMYDTVAVQDPELGLALMPKLGRDDASFKEDALKAAQNSKKEKKVPEELSWKTFDSKTPFEQAQQGDHIYLQGKDGKVLVVPRANMDDSQWRKHVDKASKRDDFVSAKIGDQDIYNGEMKGLPKPAAMDDKAVDPAAARAASRAEEVDSPGFDKSEKKLVDQTKRVPDPDAWMQQPSAPVQDTVTPADGRSTFGDNGGPARGSSVLGQLQKLISGATPGPAAAPAPYFDTSDLSAPNPNAQAGLDAQITGAPSPVGGASGTDGAPLPNPMGPPAGQPGMGMGGPGAVDFTGPDMSGQPNALRDTLAGGIAALHPEANNLSRDAGTPPMPGAPGVPPVDPLAAQRAGLEAQLGTPGYVGFNAKTQSYQPGLDLLESGRLQQREGLLKQAETEAKINDAQALVTAQTMQNTQDIEKMRLDSQRITQEQTSKAMAGYAKVQQELAAPSRQIDPDRYWKNKDAGAKFMNVIAGMCYGAAGQGTAWINHLDSLAERDVRAQQFDIENDRTRLQMRAQGYQSMYAMYREQGLDAQASFNAAKASMLEQGKKRLELIAMQSGSELIRANALKAVGELDQKVSKEQLEMTKAVNATAIGVANGQLEAAKANMEARQKALQFRLSAMMKNKGSEDIPAETLKGLMNARTLMQQAIDLKQTLPKGAWNRFKAGSAVAAEKNPIPGSMMANNLILGPEGQAMLKKIRLFREAIAKGYEENALQEHEFKRLDAAMPPDDLRLLSDQGANADALIDAVSEMYGSKLQAARMGITKHDFSQELADYERLKREGKTARLPSFKEKE